MVPGNIDLRERARSIFSQLGYTVVGDGATFRAERGWKVVQVTATEELQEVPESGSLRCFVARGDRACELRGRLRQRAPDYEWAVIAVDADDYEVERAPPGPGVLA